MAFTFLHSTLALACAAALALSPVPLFAQSNDPGTPVKLERETVTGKAAPVLEPEQAGVGGFADVPVRSLPQSVTVIGSDLIRQTNTNSLSRTIRLDASATDAYNTTGYHQSATVRGFLLDSVYNYRRNGLPVLNFGPLPIDNKAQIEVLKGVSGMLAGTSAPGGLVNLVSKMPGNDPLTTLTLRGGERGSAGAHADIGATLVNGFAYRVNVSADRLRPRINDAKGSQQLASTALAFSPSAATTLTAEAEWTRFKQPSVPGFSPLDRNGDGVGDALPAPRARQNLNNQPWSQPFENDNTILFAKLSHAFNSSWSVHAALQHQRVKTNDRIAFPDGCSSAETYVYPGFCGNGDFDVYDFRSDNERRTLNVIDAHAVGKVNIAGAPAAMTFGAQQRRYKQLLSQRQAYNFVGTSNIDAPAAFAANDTPLDPTTNLDERSRELYATAHVKWNDSWAVFAGLRSANQERSSVRTDDSRATRYSQRLTSPWAGVTFAPAKDVMLYASWGRGAESEVVPNRPRDFANPGEALPSLKNTQTEIGAKWQIAPRLLLTTAAFEIKKPFADDVFDAGGDLPRRAAGAKTARHRGVELAAAGRVTHDLSVQGSVTALDAKYVAAANAALQGTRVTNVPRLAASVYADYALPSVPGLAFTTLVTSQGKKNVFADGSLTIPALTLMDMGARYVHRWNTHQLVWRATVENVADRAAWREAPTQPWGGVYLFPAAPRTLRASVTVDW